MSGEWDADFFSPVGKALQETRDHLQRAVFDWQAERQQVIELLGGRFDPEDQRPLVEIVQGLIKPACGNCGAPATAEFLHDVPQNQPA